MTDHPPTQAERERCPTCGSRDPASDLDMRQPGAKCRHPFHAQPTGPERAHPYELGDAMANAIGQLLPYDEAIQYKPAREARDAWWAFRRGGDA